MERSIREKKDSGIFYTPLFLADYLAKKMLSFAPSKQRYSVLDPACGDGRLLASIIALNHSAAKLKLLGVDNDNTVAREISDRINSLDNSSFHFSFVNADSLMPNGSDTTPGWDRIRTEQGFSKGFDLIISNPPWGADLSAYSKTFLHNNFKCSKGQFNIYDLFVEIIVKQISNNGIYGIIVPDSIFNQEHTLIREILVKETKLLLIARLGEKVFPEINRGCSIIIGQKGANNDDNLVKCYKITAAQKKLQFDTSYIEKIEEENSSFIPQKRFKSNKEYHFDIDVVTEDEALFSKSAKHKSIGDFVEISRGAEISKKGNICKCDNCGFWFPEPRRDNYICPHCGYNGAKDSLTYQQTVFTVKTNNSYPLITGSDIFRYYSCHSKYIVIGYEGVKYKEDNYYDPKILVRKTGLGVTSALDYSGAVTVQSVYIIRPRPNYTSFPLELFEAVLGSRFITFYILKKYGGTEWQSHPYLTQKMLEELPFPDLNTLSDSCVEKIQMLATAIREEIKNNCATNISLELDLRVERFVAYLFKLDAKDYAIILKTIKNADQLIPIKRVNNITLHQLFEDGI